MTSARKRILVVGGVSWNSMLYLDALPAPRPHTVFSRGFHETVGSTGAGKAMNLSRLGFDVTLHSVLGQDEWGARVQARLAAEPFTYVFDPDPQGTERHVNLMDTSGERLSIFATYASFDPALDLDRLGRLVASADLLALNINNYCRALIPLAQAAGVPIWCDVHDWNGEDDYPRDFVAASAVLFASSLALADVDDFMRTHIAAGRELVVCTHGAAGASALTRAGERCDTPALPIDRLIDTNGAGDAFFSGFVYGHLRGDPLSQCMAYGAAAAALAVTSPELAARDLSPELLEAVRKRGAVDAAISAGGPANRPDDALGE